jgi:hypothetical protein
MVGLKGRDDDDEDDDDDDGCNSFNRLRAYNIITVGRRFFDEKIS